VMFCVDHCVYVLPGTPNLCLGGWVWVGLTGAGFDQPANPYSIWL
jgi:hypothetical protein